MNYFYLTTLTKSPAKPPKKWLMEANKQTKHACGHNNTAVFIDPAVVEDMGEAVAMSFVDYVAIGFVRQKLLDLFPEIAQCCELGRLVDACGNDITGCRPVRNNYAVPIRGGQRSRCSVCDKCRQVIYYPIGSWYLMKDSVPDQPVFAAELNGLIINEELHDRLAGRRFKRVSIQRIPVRDKPRDGQPADLNDLLL